MKRVYVCPNCQAPLRSSRALIRHLLEEAGDRGVTTAQLLEAGAGSRYGARIHELRHEDGLNITEKPLRQGSSVYKLVGRPSGHNAPTDTGQATEPTLSSLGSVASQLTVNAIFGWEAA
jgi:hypothetical protein